MKVRSRDAKQKDTCNSFYYIIAPLVKLLFKPSARAGVRSIFEYRFALTSEGETPSLDPSPDTDKHPLLAGHVGPMGLHFHPVRRQHRRKAIRCVPVGEKQAERVA